MSRHIVDVYASWQPIEEPLRIGELKFSETSRGGVFSFTYDKAFLTSDYRLQIDPQLTLHSGEFYNDTPDKNFRAFLDSSPDRWGRILMRRRLWRRCVSWNMRQCRSKKTTTLTATNIIAG